MTRSDLVLAVRPASGQLMAAGFQAHQLMKLRTMSVRFLKGKNNIADLETPGRMLPLLEKVHITKPHDS